MMLERVESEASCIEKCLDYTSDFRGHINQSIPGPEPCVVTAFTAENDPVQRPCPIMVPTDKKHSQSGEAGIRKEKEKLVLQSLSKSPLCFDLLSENTLAQQTIANYSVAR